MIASVCPRCHDPLSGSAPAGFCPRCAGRLLLDTSESVADGFGSSQPSTLNAQRFPLRLGEYELGAELGRGAMGVVYRARQPRLRREVAVKVILASRFAGESARKRFLAEAELAAQLDHPNIVPIYEVGETPDGPFYAMKLIEGGTLAEVIENWKLRIENLKLQSAGPSPPANPQFPILNSQFSIATLLTTVARAVHHAHQRGVLHRDLKPGNILLDAQGEPHIADFGVARQLGVESSLTLTGSTLGTPAYMSPEQAAGERGVTTAADVWSLGAILFHLLTGRPPFTGATATDILLQVRTQEAPRLRSLNPTIAADLETICLKCLEKDPARRYVSAILLAEDLERWLKHEPIRARPSTPTERVWKWARRHPAIAALSALAGVLFIAGVIGVAWQWRRAEAHRNIAETARETTQRANADLVALINRLEHERAEQFFLAGDSPRAAALLARMLHRDPANRRAAERLLAALAYRPFSVPEREFAGIDAAILSARSDERGLRLVGVYNQSEVQLWDATSGSAGSKFMRVNHQVFPAFTPDGRQVVLATSNNAVEIRDATNQTLLAGPLRHSDKAGATITVIRFDHAGTRLLTASTDGTARVWNLPDGAATSKPLAHGPAIRDADLSADGRLGATVTSQGELAVWDVVASRELGRHSPGVQPARLVRWAADGRHLAVVCANQRLEWREALSGRVGQAWQAPEDILSISCGHGDLTVIVQGSTTTFLWNAETGQLAAEPLPRRAAGAGLDLPPEPDRFLAVTQNGVVRNWRRRQAMAATELRHGPGLATVRFTPGGSKLLSLGTNGTAALWDAQSLQTLSLSRRFSGNILASSTDAERLLIASNSTAWLAATTTGEQVSPNFSEGAPILCGAIQPDGARVQLSTVDGALGLWDTANGVRLADYRFIYKVNGLVYSRDGVWLAARWGVYAALVGYDLTVEGNLKHNGFLDEATFSGDGKLLATASRDYSARLWVVSNRVERFQLAHEGPVARVALSPDARWLATIALVRERKAFLWDTTNGQRLGEALAHPGNALDLAFSPDSRRVATVGDDGTARVWDTATGLPLSEPLHHGATVRGVNFDPVGARLVTACDDGMVRIWELHVVSGTVEPWLPALAEALAGTRFTATEALDLTSWSETAAALATVHAAPLTNTTANWMRRVVPPSATAPTP